MTTRYVLIQNTGDKSVFTRLAGGGEKLEIKAGGAEFCSLAKIETALANRGVVAVDPVEITPELLKKAQSRLVELAKAKEAVAKGKAEAQKEADAKAKADEPLRKELAEAKDKYNSGKFNEKQYEVEKKRIKDKYAKREARATK